MKLAFLLLSLTLAIGSPPTLSQYEIFQNAIEGAQLDLTSEEKLDYFRSFSAKLKELRESTDPPNTDTYTLLANTRPAILSSLVSHINQVPSITWVAEKSPRFHKLTYEDAKTLLGVDPDKYIPLPPLSLSSSSSKLPTSFRADTHWPKCAKTINHIRDQSSCGSCWAFASTEAFNDRLCIASNGKFQELLSTQHTTSCCNALSCFSFGCNGGQPGRAWHWFQTQGVVTGGDYDTIGKGASCWPYELPPCNHHSSGDSLMPCSSGETAPKCRKDCFEPDYTIDFDQDKSRATKTYSLHGRENIKKDLMEHGPVTAAFMVHEDFLTYKGGVYRYTGGKFMGGHAVKIIGWDKEGDDEYWIVANSWNTNWGEKGFFRIKMGECSIESMISAGHVKYVERRFEDAMERNFANEL